MPAVSERFSSYRKFAEASLEEIYGERLEGALKVRATEVKSGVLMNEGEFVFKWVELPWEVQLSPVNGVASGDFNGDGKMELVLAQNHLTNWLETGYWRGRPGTHLEWDGKGWQVVPHLESGILMPGDTKAVVPIDINGDGKMDVLSASNGGALRGFVNR